jgi:capsular exopolysaccharide synthesis family protein
MSLLTISNPASAVAEAYRELRTNLHFASLETPIKTVLITSPGRQESAASVAANLAISLAQTEKRVILVDADTHQPELHALFNLNNTSGLMTMLASNAPALQESGVPGLQVLGTGPTSQTASDLLSSPRMTALIQTLTGQADMVVFCAPAILSVSDAAVLASQVDAVILAIQAGKTRRDDTLRAKEILARAKARLLGAVMLHL